MLAFEQAIQVKPADSLSQEESYVLAVEALEREVNNGGYAQFFYNSSVEFVPIIEAALRAIDCPKTADMTRDAIAALGADKLSPDAAAAAAMADNLEISAALEECTVRYFANDEPIADKLFLWIKANRSIIHIGT